MRERADGERYPDLGCGRERRREARMGEAEGRGVRMNVKSSQ